MKKIGVLTGGGDCPGLNATIRAVVRKGIKDYNYKMYGILEGWKGLIDGNIKELDMNSVSGILYRGGTIIGTSRTNPFGKDNKDDPEKILENIKKLNLYAIVSIGGEDTQGVAFKLSEMGVNVVGIPKTIDNDIPGTDYTFGFDTAVNIATEAIDRLHTTAESHNRVMVVEVMGRHTGWIATFAGIAGGADIILHTQRGGTPTAFDRVLSTRFGIAAMELIHKGESGKIVVLRGNEIIPIELKEIMGRYKTVDDYWYDLAKVFSG